MTIATIEDVDDFLEHHGVKGMKWGRRTSKTTRVARGRARKQLREEYSKNFNDRYDVVTPGGKGQRTRNALRTAAIVPDFMLVAYGPYTGTQMARSAGYSKGKSAAIGILSGAPGAAVAAEIRIHRVAKEVVNDNNQRRNDQRKQRASSAVTG